MTVSEDSTASLNAQALTEALRQCVAPDMADRAADRAGHIEQHGAHFAAEQLTTIYT